MTHSKATQEGQRISDDLAAVMSEIQRLDLDAHVAELDAVGYTIVPPEKVAGVSFIERLRNAIIEVVEKRYGARLRLDEDPKLDECRGGVGKNVHFLLFEDPVFQAAVVNPTVLAFADYMVGRSCVLNNCLSLLKGPGGEDLQLHTDNTGIPAPYSPYAHKVNVTWLLSDYSRENGALCFVPGSHRHCRPPNPGEALDERIAVEAPAGSIVVWGGNTWHGAFARQRPGTRLALVTTFVRMYILPLERYRERVTREILERNPPRFARLMGEHVAYYGFEEEGVDRRKTALLAGRSWWD